MKRTPSAFLGLFFSFVLLIPSPTLASQEEDVQHVAQQVAQALKTIPAAQVVGIGNVIIVQGAISSASEMETISRLVETLKDLSLPSGAVSVRNMAALTEQGKSELAKAIEKEIGSSKIRAYFIKSSLFIEGTAENEFVADLAIEKAIAYFRRSKSSWATASLGGQSNPRQVSAEADAQAKNVALPEAGPLGEKITIVDVMRIAPKAKPVTKP